MNVRAPTLGKTLSRYPMALTHDTIRSSCISSSGDPAALSTASISTPPPVKKSPRDMAYRTYGMARARTESATDAIMSPSPAAEHAVISVGASQGSPSGPAPSLRIPRIYSAGFPRLTTVIPRSTEPAARTARAGDLAASSAESRLRTCPLKTSKNALHPTSSARYPNGRLRYARIAAEEEPVPSLCVVGVFHASVAHLDISRAVALGALFPSCSLALGN